MPAGFVDGVDNAVRILNVLKYQEYELGYQPRYRLIDWRGYRGYQPGDDYRTIDWNVSARLGSPYVKTFTEERELKQLYQTYNYTKQPEKAGAVAYAASMIEFSKADAGTSARRAKA